MDQPVLGVWPDAYYLATVDYFNDHATGNATVAALNRADMLAGGPDTTQARFQKCQVVGSSPNHNPLSLQPSNLEGSLFPPPKDAPNIFATLGDVSTNHDYILFYKFHVDWTDVALTTFSGPLYGRVNAFNPSICGQGRMCTDCVAQPPEGGIASPNLDSGGDQLGFPMVYRNQGDHDYLLLNHTVRATGLSDQTGIRWYEYRDPYAPTGLLAPPFQESTYGGNFDGLYRWLGSIGIDHMGNIALGYSVSDGNATFPSIRYTGRDVSDPLNDLRQEALMTAGDGAQTNPEHRWGDYSGMALDPVDECTLWYTNEYYSNTSDSYWQTQVSKFRFASCDVLQCPLQFSDVAPDNVFYTSIRCLACRNVLGGYSDGTFRPYTKVTRGELAKIASGAAGFNESHTDQVFTDVPTNSPFYIWIERLASRGYISGYDCGGTNPQTQQPEPCDPLSRPYFRPSNTTTRGQLAKIISGAAGFTENHTDQIFTDVTPGATFYMEIERLASRGYISGYDCGGTDPLTGKSEPCDPLNRPYFRTYNNTTRGQTAKIVSQTFFPNCAPRTPTTSNGPVPPTSSASQPTALPAAVPTTVPQPVPTQGTLPPPVPTGGTAP